MTTSHGSTYDNSDIRRLYERIAGKYWAEQLLCDHVMRTRSLRRWLMSHAAGSVLDVACGTGANFAHLGHVASLTALDLSPAMLDRARRAAAKVDLDVDTRIGDAQDLDFADDSFDTVTTALSTCTFPEPLAALAEMARVVKPGGEILLFEHGASRARRIARFQHRRAERHYRKFGCRWNQNPVELVESAGLQVTEVRSVTFGVFMAMRASALAGEVAGDGSPSA